MKTLVKPARLCLDAYRSPDTLMRLYKTYQPRVLTRKSQNTKLLSIVHRGDLYMTFSGCNNIDDVVECINTKVIRPLPERPEILVSETPWNIYDELWEELDKILTSYLNNSEINDVVFAGHSLGGALAVLAACTTRVAASKNVYCVSFGAPQFANVEFQKLIDEKLKDQGHKRVVIRNDIVPQIKFNPVLASNGQKIELSNKKYNFIEAHSCENYMKGVHGLSL